MDSNDWLTQLIPAKVKKPVLSFWQAVKGFYFYDNSDYMYQADKVSFT